MVNKNLLKNNSSNNQLLPTKLAIYQVGTFLFSNLHFLFNIFNYFRPLEQSDNGRKNSFLSGRVSARHHLHLLRQCPRRDILWWTLPQMLCLTDGHIHSNSCGDITSLHEHRLICQRFRRNTERHLQQSQLQSNHHHCTAITWSSDAHYHNDIKPSYEHKHSTSFLKCFKLWFNHNSHDHYFTCYWFALQQSTYHQWKLPIWISPWIRPWLVLHFLSSGVHSSVA